MFKLLRQSFSVLKQFKTNEIPVNLEVDRAFSDTTLTNGIRVCTEYWQSNLSHVTIYIKCGSRNETEETSGTAHFLEHLHFKGTSKRDRTKLETDVENFGGQLNAYTSRENTSYSISATSDKLENSVEILADMLTNSKYAKSDVENERRTIHRELFETRKMQFETTIEVSHRGAYKDHQMSLPILGKIQNMYSISRDMIVDYHKANYFGSNLIIVGAGDVNHEQLCEHVDKYFAKLPAFSSTQRQAPPKPVFKDEVFLMESELTEDVNVGIFHEAPEWTDPGYYDFLILQRLLGDQPENPMEAIIFEQSQLNSFQKLIIKNPEITAQKGVYTPYHDTALFGNYFVCKPEQIDTCFRVQKQIFQQYADKIQPEELQRAKRRLFIELCLHETGNDISQAIANQILYFNRRVYRQEIAHNLARVSEQSLSETVKKYLINTPMSVTFWGNIKPIMKKYGYSKNQVGTH